MTPTQVKEFRRYTDAMKVDILEHMAKEDISVHDLRRIQKVAKAMIDFRNSYGTFSEREARGDLLRDSADDVAPSVHESLMSETFDGQAALKNLMNRMLNQSIALEHDHQDYVDAMTALPRNMREITAKQFSLPTVDEQMAVLEADLGGGDEDTVEGEEP